MIRNIIYISSIIICFSCSSVKKLGQEAIYTETSGLTLEFVFKSKTSGFLYVVENRDTILFNYRLNSSKKEVIEPKKKVLKSIRFFEYNISYLNDKHENYEILKKFKVLYSFKKREKIIYKSHN
jgi:hypothetical protein